MPPRKPSKDIILDAERLLKVRPRSVGELRDRLLRKGYAPDVVDTVLGGLEKTGVLDDRAFARWWIEQRSNFRPTGPFGLSMELKGKRVTKETVQAAIAESGVQGAELELAKGALEPRLARYRRLDHLTKRRRIAGFLARRGFSSRVISEIIGSL
jgi:regulatory protein